MRGMVTGVTGEVTFKLSKKGGGGGCGVCRKVPNFGKLLLVRICAENGSNCEYMQKTVKIAIPHPLHIDFFTVL